MADENIKRDFIEGICEVYSIMFTDGKNDGIYFYPLYEPKVQSVYKELKYRQYLSPLLLVAKVKLTPEQGDEVVKTVKEKAVFTVPYKSLVENLIDVSNKNLPNLRKGLIKYKDTFYDIDNVKPATFVEDTFLTYIFECTEDVVTKEVSVFAPETEGDSNG